MLVTSTPSVFDAVRLGHVPGIYSSWKESQPQAVGTLADVKRYSSRKKADEYKTRSTGPGDPLFKNPTAHIIANESAFPSGPAAWGVHITFSASKNTR